MIEEGVCSALGYVRRANSTITAPADTARATAPRESERRSLLAPGATIGKTHEAGTSFSKGQARRSRTMISSASRLSIAAPSSLRIARAYREPSSTRQSCNPLPTCPRDELGPHRAPTTRCWLPVSPAPYTPVPLFDQAELSAIGSEWRRPSPALSRTSGGVALAGMLRLTPRATAIVALARREAESLGQPCTSGHVLVVLIWEAGGVAARALSEAGLAKGSEDVVRRWLRRWHGCASSSVAPWRLLSSSQRWWQRSSPAAGGTAILTAPRRSSHRHRRACSRDRCRPTAASLPPGSIGRKRSSTTPRARPASSHAQGSLSSWRHGRSSARRHEPAVRRSPLWESKEQQACAPT